MYTEENAKDLYHDARGPILRVFWGGVVINGEEHSETEKGRVGKGKDIFLLGEKVRRWKEREGHCLKKSMIERVYEEKVEVLILGIGISSAIEVPDKVKEDIEKHGIQELIVAPTPAACRMYNQCYHEGKKVALLAHGTC